MGYSEAHSSGVPLYVIGSQLQRMLCCLASIGWKKWGIMRAQLKRSDAKIFIHVTTGSTRGAATTILVLGIRTQQCGWTMQE
jgi:hypothetical protein